MLQLSFVNFKQGTYIFVEGNPQNDRFYIIQSGKVHFSREVEILPSINSNTLGPGDFIGVIPCMCNHTQLESIIALSDLTLIAVRREQYPDLIAKNAAVAMKIIMSFSQKMRLLNEIMAVRSSKQVQVHDTEALYTVAAYYDQAGKYNSAVYVYYQYMKSQSTGANIEMVKMRFVALKPRSKAVYLEPRAEDTVRNYPAGTMIFCEQQKGEDMFIIQEGEVEISKVISNNEVIFAVLKKGDFFGEMALLENMPRSASAIAHTDCKLMAVNRKNFNTMVATQPQLIARLTTTLADRLWSMYRQISNTFIPEDQAKLFDMLALQIEKTKSDQNSLQLSITLFDLANMCAIPVERQNQALEIFRKDRRFKIIDNKIFVSDCKEIVHLSTLFRKKK